MPPANRIGGPAQNSPRQGSSKDLDEQTDSVSSPVSSAPHKAKRKRITPEQQEVLSKVFETTDTPNLEMREQLSKQIGMTPREIQVYYQNQRAKRRRLARSEAAQAALSAATAGATPPPYASPPFAVSAMTHTGPSALVTTMPGPPLVLPPPVPSPSAYYPRRRSFDDLLAATSPRETPRDEGRIRLPPLREVFPDLLPPIPANYHQTARAGSASPNLGAPVLPHPSFSRAEAVSVPLTRVSSSTSSQPILPEGHEQVSDSSTPQKAFE